MPELKIGGLTLGAIEEEFNDPSCPTCVLKSLGETLIAQVRHDQKRIRDHEKSALESYDKINALEVRIDELKFELYGDDDEED